MDDVWVSESIEDISCIGYEKILVSIHARNDLIEESFVHEGRNKIALHTVFYSIETCLISCKYAHCVCTVEDSYLSCSVECHIRCPDNVEAGLSCRKFVFIASLLIFDGPEEELLCAVQKVILIAKLVADCFCFCSWITRNDSVYK